MSLAPNFVQRMATRVRREQMMMVGDEFPAKEVRNEPPEEEPVVHHHHYYRGRYRDYRYRGRWLWFVLWILVVSAIFRAFDMAAGVTGWAWRQWGGPWGAWGGWMWGPFHARRARS